jgi:hypothetical protein
MSDAPSTINPTTRPTPWPASTDRRGRLTWVLGLVRKLIDYGKELSTTLGVRGLSDRPAGASICFGTVDVAAILSRIAAALLRAEALEGRLLRGAARADPQPREPRVPIQRAPRAARPRGETAAPPDPLLARLPTAEQIAADMRRKPVGAVLLDICRDLGIVADHPLWRELNLAIITHGGGLTAFFKDILQRANATWRAMSALAMAPESSPLLAREPPCTGPP